jgi:hypothetical protein
MMKGKTTNGFEFEVDPVKFEDYEFFEAYTKWVTNGYYLPTVLDALLGEDQKKKLIEYLKKEEGKATTKAMAETLTEICQIAITENKNAKN